MKHGETGSSKRLCGPCIQMCINCMLYNIFFTRRTRLHIQYCLHRIPTWLNGMGAETNFHRPICSVPLRYEDVRLFHSGLRLLTTGYHFSSIDLKIRIVLARKLETTGLIRYGYVVLILIDMHASYVSIRPPSAFLGHSMILIRDG